MNILTSLNRKIFRSIRDILIIVFYSTSISFYLYYSKAIYTLFILTNNQNIMFNKIKFQLMIETLVALGLIDSKSDWMIEECI